MFCFLIFIVVIIVLINKLNEILGMRVGFHIQRENIYTPYEDDQAEKAEVSEIDTAMADIVKSYPKFNVNDFLIKAQKAFSVIFSAYASEDLNTLKELLAPRIFQAFSMAIKDRKARNETLEGILVRFICTEIVSSDVSASDLFITVRFETEQSNVLKDGNGQVIEGNADFVETRTDVWVFSRKKDSTDPRWFLHEIKSEETK